MVPQTQEEQCDFQSGHGTLLQLDALMRVLVEAWEAYDCVPRDILWEVFQEYRIDGP